MSAAGVLAPPILVDTSDEGLVRAVQADLVATRISHPDVPVEVHLDPDVAWCIGLDGAGRSAVAAARFVDETADSRIAGIVGAYRALGAPFVWWRSPFDRPRDLGVRLDRHGVPVVGTVAAMGMALDALPRLELPAGLEIVPVVDLATLDEILGVFAAEHGPPTPEEAVMTAARRAHIAPRLADEPVPLRYVGRLGGMPVAASRVSLAGGAAGLYSMLTLEPARRRGIGRAMALAALHAARSVGLRVAVLQATELGLPVYQGIGFRPLFEYAMHAPERARR